MGYKQRAEKYRRERDEAWRAHGSLVHDAIKVAHRLPFLRRVAEAQLRSHGLACRCSLCVDARAGLGIPSQEVLL